MIVSFIYSFLFNKTNSFFICINLFVLFVSDMIIRTQKYNITSTIFLLLFKLNSFILYDSCFTSNISYSIEIILSPITLQYTLFLFLICFFVSTKLTEEWSMYICVFEKTNATLVRRNRQSGDVFFLVANRGRCPL